MRANKGIIKIVSKQINNSLLFCILFCTFKNNEKINMIMLIIK